MATKKPKGWGDWNPVGKSLKKMEKTSKGAISKTSLTKANKAGMAAKKTAIELAVGDPKKGPLSMGINLASWGGAPYVKGAKVVNLAIKGKKYAKTAKTVRGVVKTAGATGINLGYDAAANKVAKKGIKRTPVKRVPRKK